MISRLPLVLVAIAVAAYVVRVALVWDQLPPVLASHFGFSGQADDWMSKPAFFAFDAAIVALIASIPLWFRILPARMINLPLPDRDYWLAPERRRETLSRMAPWISWMTLMAILFLLFTLDTVVRANLSGAATPRLEGMGRATFAFLVAMAIWALLFYRASRRLWRPT